MWRAVVLRNTSGANWKINLPAAARDWKQLLYHNVYSIKGGGKKSKSAILNLHMENSADLWQMTHWWPVRYWIHWAQWGMTVGGMSIYCMMELRFCSRCCNTGGIRRIPVCHWRSLRKVATGRGLNSRWRKQEVVLDRLVGLMAGRRQNIGALLQFAVELTQCFRNRHVPEKK